MAERGGRMRDDGELLHAEDLNALLMGEAVPAALHEVWKSKTYHGEQWVRRWI